MIRSKSVNPTNYVMCSRCGRWSRTTRATLLRKRVAFGEIRIFRMTPREQTGKLFLCPECTEKFAKWVKRGLVK